ncbi:MAG: arylsulfatase [Solirubrobacterales bacterium]
MTQFEGVVGRTLEESAPWWPPATPAPAKRPNVVMIVLDDVGFAQLGCYGSSMRTPNIDRLAATGLRYVNFHTTALCSPTRACLLTGRNHHSVGIGTLANWDTGFPGNSGAITKRAATLAEMLRPQGYNTFAAGKWHLTPPDQQSPAGPYDHWPLQRGFERYYGFLDAATSQWDPELTVDNRRIETPRAPGYHLSEDLVDQSIDLLRNQSSWAPEKPFFLYLAFGACHEPHHVPADFIERNRGRFDQGWDACRAEWLERQKEMGIVPASTVLPERNPGVPAWDELSGVEREVFLRLQETFAGMLEHVDAQVGRLTDSLARIGRLEDTLIMVVSDNGASQEGSPVGTFNTMLHHNGLEDSVEENHAHIQDFGTPRGNSNYPLGWAMAGNTPCKWYKQNTHGGGVRDPFIVSWPAGIAEGGAIRQQFHHATDVVPTVLEIAGIEAPSSVEGVAQIPVEGISMRYSFDDAGAPSRKRSQYFEMLGHRGIYADGWKAVTHHDAGTSFDADQWELYDLRTDFSEVEDLAATHPERLRRLIELWWAEAGKFGVLPLDDRIFERWSMPARPGSIGDRRVFKLYRGISHVGNDTAPNLRDASHSIQAEIDRGSDDDGVIVAHGGCSGGYALYVLDGRLTYHYNRAGRRFRVSSEEQLPAGISTVRMEFARSGRCSGHVTLLVDGVAVGDGEIAETLPYAQSVEGFDVGQDRLTPVADEYESPFPFAGTLDHVVIEIGDDRERDIIGEIAAATRRD